MMVCLQPHAYLQVSVADNVANIQKNTLCDGVYRLLTTLADQGIQDRESLEGEFTGNEILIGVLSLMSVICCVTGVLCWCCGDKVGTSIKNCLLDCKRKRYVQIESE